MRGPPRKRQDIDNFIDNELEDIEQSQPSKQGFKPPTGVGSKPAFAMGAKKPNSFATKPTFGAPSASKKPSSYQANSEPDDVEESTENSVYKPSQV
jgi:hypothetical protein